MYAVSCSVYCKKYRLLKVIGQKIILTCSLASTWDTRNGEREKSSGQFPRLQYLNNRCPGITSAFLPSLSWAFWAELSFLPSNCLNLELCKVYICNQYRLIESICTLYKHESGWRVQGWNYSRAQRLAGWHDCHRKYKGRDSLLIADSSHWFRSIHTYYQLLSSRFGFYVSVYNYSYKPSSLLKNICRFLLLILLSPFFAALQTVIKLCMPKKT